MEFKEAYPNCKREDTDRGDRIHLRETVEFRKDNAMQCKNGTVLFVTTSWTFVYEFSSIIADFNLPSNPFFTGFRSSRSLSPKPSQTIMQT